MKKLIILVFAVIAIVALVAGCSTTETEEKTETVTGTNSKGAKITIDQLADIQPGTAVQMKEVGDRLWVLYYAGIDGNWELAEYQIHEAESAISKLDITRPKRQELFKAFIDEDVEPLHEAVDSKDADGFKATFDEVVKSCNACHKKEKKAFIKWKVPSERPSYLETKEVK